MATDQPQSTISLKLLVDEEKNRVVVAEADKDFVDVLFSFLTLPMGTIIRLLSTRTEPPRVGSLSSLYKGVADLDAQYFQTETCKSMLLSPRNSSEALCKNLKLNIDDTEPTKYYMCDCRVNWNQPVPILSAFKNTRCSCGKVMNEEIGFEDSEVASKVDNGEGVFVKGMAKFMITDDLKVSLASDFSFALLNSIGIRDMKAVQVMEINLGSQEVLNLLAGALFSKTPLTDVFLRKLAFPSYFSKGEFEPKGSLGAPNESQPTTNTNKMEVKLHSMKSSKKILFAEVGEDFVDFLFSFLAFPLGSMVKLSGSNSSLGCIDNLYGSVGSSDFVKYMKSQDCKARLLSPKIAEKFYVQNGLLDVEELRRDYRFTTRHANSNREYTILTTNTGYYCTESFMNPKASTWKTQGGGGFVRRPSTFTVTDDLVVTPTSFISNIALLRRLEVPASEVENRVISVGKDEWPGSYCNTKPCCCPRKARPAADFYIHGLWPNCNNGSYPSYCDRNSRFDRSDIKGLVDELRRSWPSLACPRSDGYRFWTHEWEKHGTCSESALNLNSYFEAALKLKQKADLLRALERKGIRPGRNSYRLQHIIEAIRERTGFTPGIKCDVDPSSHVQLYQIYLCVDSSASNFIECPIFPTSRCGSGSSLIGFPSFDGWHDFPTQEMELKDLISTLMKK